LDLPDVFIFRPFRAWFISGFLFGGLLPPVLSFALTGLRLISFTISSA